METTFIEDKGAICLKLKHPDASNEMLVSNELIKWKKNSKCQLSVSLAWLIGKVWLFY